MVWVKKNSGGGAQAPVRAQGKAEHKPHHKGESERDGRRTEHSVTLGKSLQVKGELTGREDVTIDGKVEGKVTLKDHNLTVGQNGHITAEVHAKTVVVVGTVVGNIFAGDKVEVASSGTVDGDIHAPRVVLSEGCRFKGKIDMGLDHAPAKESAAESSPSSPLLKRNGGSQQPQTSGPATSGTKDRPARV